ncbi:MAG TPA: ABC transporter permease, partial [Acidimicrobiales bacterium]|nr:ABC transporter permease [Acidimicrobiales bacterium]
MTDLMVPAVEASEVPAARSGNQGVVRRFMRDRFAVAGLLVLALMTVLAVFAPVIAQHDPEQLFVGVPFEEPSGAHWFGTDDLGRDNASRIVYGTRVALRVALEVAAITLLIAVPLGLMAGFAGGVMDFLLMRLVDAVQAVPPLIFALAVASAFDLSFNWALFGVGVSLSPSLTRIVRAETLAVREETFIEASVAVGSRTSWILLRRVLPNIASPIIVQTTIFMGVAILAEAGLSILGVGLSPGSAAWGS